MSDLTAASTVEIRIKGAGAWTDLSDPAVGLGAWQMSDTHDTRDVPSIPATRAVQLLDSKRGAVSFTVDDNARTHPIMFLRSGTVFEVRVRREGTGAGLPQVLVEGPATINAPNAPGGVRSFQFSLTVTSRTESTQ